MKNKVDTTKVLDHADKYIRGNVEKRFKYADEEAKCLCGSLHEINHVREIHVSTRLREAEEFEMAGQLHRVLRKIESAIGYLYILHYHIATRILKEGGGGR